MFWPVSHTFLISSINVKIFIWDLTRSKFDEFYIGSNFRKVLTRVNEHLCLCLFHSKNNHRNSLPKTYTFSLVPKRTIRDVEIKAILISKTKPHIVFKFWYTVSNFEMQDKPINTSPTFDLLFYRLQKNKSKSRP